LPRNIQSSSISHRVVEPDA
jgi:BlaI family penicillinase repressor